MEKQMKLFTNMTKPLVLFVLLFALGVGQMWGTRLFQTGQKVYFQDATLTYTMSGNRWKSGTNGNVYAYFFNQKDHVGDNDVTNWAEGAGKLVYGTDGAANAIYEFTVPSLPSGGDGVWWGVIFTRGTAASWDNSQTWNQTADQYPADEKSLFTIKDEKSSSKWNGTWSVMPEMLCSSITSPEWSKEDGLFFTDYSGEKGIVKINCTASQSFQFIVFDGTYYKSYADETNTTWADYGPKTDGGYNFQFQADEAGEYIFQWDKTNHKLWVWEPKARLAKQKYIYFDARNLTGSNSDYWQRGNFTARFWFKYYDSGSDKGSVDCTKANALEDWVYYALVPDDEYLGQIQMNRLPVSSESMCAANVAYAKNRTNVTQNCLTGSTDWCSSWDPSWTTYCPPTTSETFADNSTTKISWQPDTNDGSTSGKAIWVKTGTTIKVAATASKAVADDNMTIKYDFKVNSTSQQDGTTASYTHSASTNDTEYAISADIYTNYNLDNTKNSTKHTQSSIFYKALNTYSVTHTLSGVTKASGREGDDAAAYHVAYDATYTANAGYYLPSDITVTIGGATKTKDTDYTWTVTDGTSGALAILTDKIDGNVVVTINGVWRWSVAGSWKVITPGEGDPYWDADTYAMGTITKVSSDDVCSVEVTLSANTNYTFKIADRAAIPYEYWGNNTSTFYMAYGNSSNWTFGNDASNTAACGLTTAGAGTYTFTYNITQHKVSVIYPESFQVTAAGNPAAGGTVAPASATYMSTEVGGEITATPNYSHYFNGWTSNAGGTFVTNTATATFKPSATSTVTAAFAERTAFIEGNFQVYNSDRSVRTKTGNAWQDASTTIKMTYDAGNNRYYLHTYSTPTELREQLNDAGAFFYVKTSTSSSSIADAATYKACNSAAQSLSEYGSSHSLLVTTGESEHGFKFTGSEDGYVIIYFNGTSVWYELECALSYYGGDGATGDAPAARTYYAYESNQTAAANTYSKTGYSFDHWDTAADDSGTDYAAGATNVAMNAREVCLHAQWEANDYTINLANMEATTPGATSVDVTFDASTNMTASDPIDKPTKTHYDFAGYWTSENTGATLDHQLIGADGKWIKDVEGYTSHDGSGNPTWVHDYPISLYAKWDEDLHDVTIAVSPADAGVVQVSGETVSSVSDVGFVTHSPELTAVPSNAAWVFKEWRVSDDTKLHLDLTNYSLYGENMKITATDDGQTLTAVFEPRYYLVGGEITGEGDGGSGTSSGMPGWDSYTKPFNVITSSPILATCSLTLGTNKNFYIMVRDKADGLSYGKSGGISLGDDASITFTDKDNKVLFYSNGGTNYTFKITGVDGSGRPTVSVERPHQMHFAHKRVDIDGNDHNDDLGGTLTATINGESAAHEQWFDYGSDVEWTATAETGYSLTWYTDKAYSNAMNPQPDASWSDPNITKDENIFAKFTEKTTTVSLENDGHGKVQIGGVDETGTTVGVTTTRSLTAVPNDGYAFKDWSKPSGDDITLSSTTTNPTTLTGVGAGLSEGQRVYASFSEIARTITASAGTGGTVDAASYTAYIDTKTDITATPATGYKFKEWQETGGTSNVTFDDVHSASTKIKATGDATIQAVFEPRWAIAGSWKTYPESTAWDADTYKLGNIGTNGSSKDTCYVEITLPANTDLTFKIVDRGADGTVAVGSYVDYGNNTTATQYMKYNNHTNWGFGLKSSGYYDCGITTTGGGTYKFAFNITDKSLTVTYQTSYQSNFGWKYADGSGTLHDGDNGGTITVTASDGGSHTISSGDWVAAGASITYLASPAAGYAFGGWHNNSDCSTGKFNDNLSWTDGPLAATSNSYAKFVPVTVTYNDGSGDGKWGTASNWSPACVPTIDHDVVITKPVTVDIAHATAKSIVLDQNSHTGKLTIQANKGLEVAGTITRTTDGSNRLATRPEDLILESSSAGNASLIFNNSNSCQATVQMYSIGAIVSESQWNWQFMGTPFTSANALYSYYGSYLYEWKAGGYWDAVANGGTMTPFTGYCITQDEPTTYVMDGTLNPTTSKTLSVPAGVEMVFANSWSAPIDIGTFTDDAFGIDTKTVYLFNTGYAPNKGDATEGTAAGTYVVVPIHSSPYTGNELIAPMQGFYVDNTSGSVGSITMDYATVVRPTRTRDIVAGAMHAPKRAVAAENEPAVMKIKATGSRYSERIVILEREDFSAGFDNGWDGKNLNEPGVAPILYALREDGTKDAVSAIPTYEGTVVGFRIGEDNNYTFSFNFDGEDIWYLNDLKEEKSTLIDAANTYSFVAEAGDAEARFIISATPIQKLPTGIGNDANDAMVKVRKLIINDQLFIIRAGRMYNAVGSIVK